MGKRELSRHVLHALERCGAILLAALIGLLLFATLRAQLARAAEFPTDSGAGTLSCASAGGHEAAAPLSTDIRISVAGIVARVTVAQRFRNTGATTVEALYTLPLPDDAAVDRLQMRVGERLIEGEIRERAQAERVYGAARAAGQRASLVRQSTPNLFTTAVANIGPGESIDISIEYLQTARYDDGEFTLRLPLTLTPRYGQGDTAEQKAGADFAALPARGQSAANANTAAHEASVRVVLAPGVPLTEIGSRAHEVRVLREHGHYVLETLAPRVPMDRDFVVAWRPQLGSTPTVAALTQTLGDTTYALLMLLPPADLHAYRAQPRELIYVIDTSGSMGGQPIEQAKAALANALGRLSGADRFNILQFNSWTQSLYPASMPFNAESYAQALKYVEDLRATGGTDMEPAILAALAPAAAPGYLRQVIFMTDGAVANETGLFTVLKRQLRDARLFTVGIGAAPNSYFMRKAAQFGRGTYTHIGDGAAVATAMQALFEKIGRVALTDVLVDWPDAAEIYPLQVPDLYKIIYTWETYHTSCPCV
jgi:Ca-activated chloride channel family protein